MSKLDEIINETVNDAACDEQPSYYAEVELVAKLRIKHLFLELLGEDEATLVSASGQGLGDKWQICRDNYRFELRKKIDDL